VYVVSSYFEEMYTIHLLLLVSILAFGRIETISYGRPHLAYDLDLKINDYCYGEDTSARCIFSNDTQKLEDFCKSLNKKLEPLTNEKEENKICNFRIEEISDKKNISAKDYFFRIENAKLNVKIGQHYLRLTRIAFLAPDRAGKHFYIRALANRLNRTTRTVLKKKKCIVIAYWTQNKVLSVPSSRSSRPKSLANGKSKIIRPHYFHIRVFNIRDQKLKISTANTPQHRIRAPKSERQNTRDQKLKNSTANSKQRRIPAPKSERRNIRDQKWKISTANTPQRRIRAPKSERQNTRDQKWKNSTANSKQRRIRAPKFLNETWTKYRKLMEKLGDEFPQL